MGAVSTRDYTNAVASPYQQKFVGRIVREARLARDITPAEAAKQVGITRSTFYRWEQGDIGATTVLLLYWLYYDPTGSHDAFYWRERALAAEDALAKIKRVLDSHYETAPERSDR